MNLHRQGAGLLATAALVGGLGVVGMAGPAATAHAAGAPPRWNNISGKASRDGNWTAELAHRHVTTEGPITFDLQNNVDGGLCVRLMDLKRDTSFGLECWSAGEYGPKQLTKGDVRAGTVFRVDVRKRGNGRNSDWGGRIFY